METNQFLRIAPTLCWKDLLIPFNSDLHSSLCISWKLSSTSSVKAAITTIAGPAFIDAIFLHSHLAHLLLYYLRLFLLRNWWTAKQPRHSAHFKPQFLKSSPIVVSEKGIKSSCTRCGEAQYQIDILTSPSCTKLSLNWAFSNFVNLLWSCFKFTVLKDLEISSLA